MPIEIRELVIKVTVTEEKKKVIQSKELQEIKNELIKKCVEQVMTKLETLAER